MKKKVAEKQLPTAGFFKAF